MKREDFKEKHPFYWAWTNVVFEEIVRECEKIWKYEGELGSYEEIWIRPFITP